jgi:hypothetical protein
MEKSFNDQELADIMSEIENLEREFAQEAAMAPAPEPEPVTEPVAEDNHDVLHQLVAAPEEKVIMKTNHEDKIVHFKPQAPAPAPAPATQTPSTLTFQIQGEMSVQLAFEVNGQRISLNVTGDDLCIETDSGAKFTLPIAARKAA